MRTRNLLISAATLGFVAVGTGCGSAHKASTPWSNSREQTTKVTLRFVAPENESWMAGANATRSTRLVSDESSRHDNKGGFVTAGTGADSNPQNVVLWGGPYQGNDVTYSPTVLPAGSYTFGYFDPDRGATFQGWISVNSGGDDVLSTLNEWREAARQQEEWLAYENKINGRLDSRDEEDFNQFMKQIKELRQLQARIDATIRAENAHHAQMNRQRNEMLGGAEVLLLPGASTHFQPTTQPAFAETDLHAVKDGQAMTKVILAGDYQRTVEKMDRLSELQQEMQRCRTVFVEEVRRLQNRRDYYRITAHLFNHDERVIQNERRLQHTRGMIAQIDRQVNETRRRAHAQMFVAGLFAPEEADAAFHRETTELQRQRMVFAERLRQVDLQFNDASAWNEKRVSLEQQRQELNGEIEEIDAAIGQIKQAQVVAAQLRNSTNVIHRQGPTTVMAASYMGDSLPSRLANAIEHDSMMTVRLEAVEELNVRTTRSETTMFEQTTETTVGTPTPKMAGGGSQDSWGGAAHNQPCNHPSQPAQTQAQTANDAMRQNSPLVQHQAQTNNDSWRNNNNQPAQPSQPSAQDNAGQQNNQRSQPTRATTQANNDSWRNNNQPAQPTQPSAQDDSWRQYNQRSQPTQAQAQADNDPWRKNDQPSAGQAQAGPQGESRTMLVSQREGESMDKPAAEKPQDQPKAKKSNACPWYIKVLVPPCWIEELKHKND